MLKIEGDDVTAIEVADCLNDLEDTLKMRKEDGFLSPLTDAEKPRLIDHVHDADEMASTRKAFFGNNSTLFQTIL